MDSSTQVHLLSDASLIQAVNDSYSAIAKTGTSASYASSVALAFGYSIEQLQSIPAESHMGLSCGNPVAAASIREGETVLDLGSGGGIDILLASAKTGPRGKAIGLDMSTDMISLARRNALKKGLHPPQVAFVQAALAEPLPIASNSVDCILSNCVVNLLPLSGKGNLLKETHRVLKPGGRIVLDDIIAKKSLPDSVRNDLAAYVGCISGAIEIEVYKSILTKAGFQDVVFVDTHGDLSVYSKTGSAIPGCCTQKVETTSPQKAKGCCGAPASQQTPVSTQKVETTSPQKAKGCCGAPASQTTPVTPVQDFDVNSWAAAYQIYAVKSSTTTTDPNIITEPLLRWWDAYPTATSSPALMSGDELSSRLRDPTRCHECAVIDVRGNDSMGGHVKGSLQYPAQTFYNGLAQFAEKFGEKKEVIFYCGNSNGRGPRCAGWYLDYVNHTGHTSPKVYVLQGGITSWLAKFGNEKELVDHE